MTHTQPVEKKDGRSLKFLKSLGIQFCLTWAQTVMEERKYHTHKKNYRPLVLGYEAESS